MTDFKIFKFFRLIGIIKKKFMNTTFDNYPVKPYISLNRDVEAWLLNLKPVPK
ncbi:hypothetical protein HMPREF1111_0105 [Streptococcus infantis ATCC 700779]|nr:hypothetical protein HMPREF1111_0105 [Streptococcus infantis ATCC 700779]